MNFRDSRQCILILSVQTVITQVLNILTDRGKRLAVNFHGQMIIPKEIVKAYVIVFKRAISDENVAAVGKQSLKKVIDFRNINELRTHINQLEYCCCVIINGRKILISRVVYQAQLTSSVGHLFKIYQPITTIEIIDK